MCAEPQTFLRLNLRMSKGGNCGPMSEMGQTANHMKITRSRRRLIEFSEACLPEVRRALLTACGFDQE